MGELKNIEAWMRATETLELRIIMADSDKEKKIVSAARLDNVNVYGIGNDLAASLADLVKECRKIQTKMSVFDLNNLALEENEEVV